MEIRSEPSTSALATRLLASYVEEIAARLPGGFDLALSVSANTDELAPPRGEFLVVFEADGEGVGCGGLKDLGSGAFEIKRMWIAPSRRGRGYARALLGGARGSGARSRRERDAPGYERGARRGRRPLPGKRLHRDRPVQRQSLRLALVRETPARRRRDTPVQGGRAKRPSGRVGGARGPHLPARPRRARGAHLGALLRDQSGSDLGTYRSSLRPPGKSLLEGARTRRPGRPGARAERGARAPRATGSASPISSRA